MANALKLTISGHYVNGRGERSDFINVTGVLPNVDIDVASMHMQSRYAVQWLKASAEYSTNGCRRVQSVFVDDVAETEHDFSFIGKNILELNADELQDLAVYKDLREVPLRSTVSLREARQITYVAYSKKVLSKIIKIDSDAGLSELAPIVVQAGVVRDYTQKMSNDDILSSMQDDGAEFEPVASTIYTLQDLRELLALHNIKYSNNSGIDKLTEKAKEAGLIK